MELVQTPRIKLAEEVLRHLSTMEGPCLTVEGFVNGREQGYSVSNYRVQASFSEDRNSDSITVQFGLTSDFSMQGNVLHPADLSDVATRRWYANPARAAEGIRLFLMAHPSKVEVTYSEYVPYPLHTL